VSVPLATSILTDLFAALRTNLGTYDLSDSGGTHRVVLADGGRPAVSLPYLLLSSPSSRLVYDEAALGTYRVDGRLEWWAFAPTTALDLETRAAAAQQLAHEVITAIQNAHANPALSINGLVTVLLPSVIDVFADGPEVQEGEAQVHGEIVYRAYPTRGI
jgi:hypothetical protein